MVNADAGTSYAAAFINGRHTIQNGDHFIHCASRSDGVLGGVEWDGSSVAVFTSSDKKWKDNIRDTVRDAMTAVKSLTHRDYERNGHTVLGGLVANEIEAYMPDAVTTRTFRQVVKQDDGTTKAIQKTSMFISMGVVDTYYRQAVTELAREQDLQRRQIDFLKAEAERRGWDMSTFPLQ